MFKCYIQVFKKMPSKSGNKYKGGIIKYHQVLSIYLRIKHILEKLKKTFARVVRNFSHSY